MVLEPDRDARPGERVFDLVWQGVAVHRGVDPVALADRPRKAVTLTWTFDAAADTREASLALVPGGSADRPPMLSGLLIERVEP